jgi:hypothetical protein
MAFYEIRIFIITFIKFGPLNLLLTPQIQVTTSQIIYLSYN